MDRDVARVSVEIDRKRHERLVKILKENGQSFTWWANRQVREWLEENDSRKRKDSSR